jgi:hypothetical protein
MSAPVPQARRAAFVTALRRFPLALAHPVVLTFVASAYFSYVSADTVVWAGASVWELTPLYLQPNLATDSNAHPTLSYLADPLLASVAGRSAVLFGWLAFGWYLARR